MGILDDELDRSYPFRYRDNPVGTETTHPDTLTARTWWDDLKDAAYRGITDPAEALKLGVGLNPAAGIVLSAPDVAEGAGGLARDIWKGDVAGSRQHSLQLGLGALGLVPFAGTVAREAKPVLSAAARTAAHEALPAAETVARDAVPAARRALADDLSRLSPTGEPMPTELPGILSPSAPSAPPKPQGLPPGLPPTAPERAAAVQARVQDARDLRASRLSESLLSEAPPPPEAPAGTDALSRGLLSPTRQVQNVYDKALSQMDTEMRGSAGGRTAGTGSGRQGTIAAVPSLRDQSLPDAIAQAESGVHVIPKPGGGFVGAPANIRNEADLAAQRAAFDAQVAQGAPGGDWYERVRGWLRQVSGKDPQMGRQLAEELGLFSPQSDPNTNLLFALQASDAYAAGKPLKIARTGQQAERFNETRDAQFQAWLRGEPMPAMPQGDKTGVFEGHMDYTRPGGTTGTNDIWHARALGYVDPDGKPWSSGLTGEQHQWMDHETVLAVARANKAKLNGRDNWTAAEIQAAPWVAGKAADLAERYKIPLSEGMERAIKTYPDFAGSYTGSFPHEQVPYAGSGVGTGTMTPAQFDKAAQWTTPIGKQDALSRVAGLHTQPSVSGTGVYTPEGMPTEYNQVTIGRPMFGFQKSPGDLAAGDAAREEAARLNLDREAWDREFGYRTPTLPAKIPPDKDPRVVPSYTQANATGVQAVRGLTDFQGGSTWHIIDTQAPGTESNSLKITTKNGKPPTADQMQRLEEIANRRGYVLSNTGDGVSFINFDQPGKQYETYGANDEYKRLVKRGRTGSEVARELKGGMQAEIDAVLPRNTTLRGRYHGDYVDLADQLSQANQGQGKATATVLDYLRKMHEEAPAAFGRMLDAPEIAAKAADNLKRLEASGQLGARPDYEELLRLMADGRLRGLLERVREKGVSGLPAVVGAGGLGGAAAGSQLPGILDNQDNRS